jgi:hypothetical protein
MANPNPGRTPQAPRVNPAARIPSRVQVAGLGSTPAPQAPTANRRAVLAPVLLQAGPPLAREQTKDRQANQVQTNTLLAIRQSKANPRANSNLLEGVALQAGVPTLVAHGLGAPFRGVALSGFSAATTWSVQRAGANPQQDRAFVLLTATNNVVCDVEVWA